MDRQFIVYRVNFLFFLNIFIVSSAITFFVFNPS